MAIFNPFGEREKISMIRTSKLFPLSPYNMGFQIIKIIDGLEEDKWSVVNIDMSPFVYKYLINEMNVLKIKDGSISKVYKSFLRDSVKMSINPLFVFNLIEVTGEQEWNINMKQN